MGEGFDMDSLKSDIAGKSGDSESINMPYIGTEQEVKEQIEADEQLEKENKKQDDNSDDSEVSTSANNYYCESCKTSYYTNNPLATYCIYCGGANVVPTSANLFDGYEVIPFVKTYEDAYSIIKKDVRFNPLVPFSYRGKNIKRKIRRVFLPCTLYSLDVDGDVSFLGRDGIAKVQGMPIQTFESGFDVHFEFSHFLSSRYSKLTDAIISNINDYDYLKAVPFEIDQVKDIYCIFDDIKADDSLNESKQKVSKYALGVVKKNVPHEQKKLNNNKVSINTLSTRNILLPAYMLNLNYNGKEYLILINGQTGKAVINLPIGRSSVVVFSIVIFIIIFLISILVASIL